MSFRPLPCGRTRSEQHEQYCFADRSVVGFRQPNVRKGEPYLAITEHSNRRRQATQVDQERRNVGLVLNAIHKVRHSIELPTRLSWHVTREREAHKSRRFGKSLIVRNMRRRANHSSIRQSIARKRSRHDGISGSPDSKGALPSSPPNRRC